jgi:hypothetical protein
VLIDLIVCSRRRCSCQHSGRTSGLHIGSWQRLHPKRVRGVRWGGRGDCKLPWTWPRATLGGWDLCWRRPRSAQSTQVFACLYRFAERWELSSATTTSSDLLRFAPALQRRVPRSKSCSMRSYRNLLWPLLLAAAASEYEDSLYALLSVRLRIK